MALREGVLERERATATPPVSYAGIPMYAPGVLVWKKAWESDSDGERHACME